MSNRDDTSRPGRLTPEVAAMLTHVPGTPEGVTDAQRRKLDDLAPGRGTAAALMASEEVRALIRAAGRGKSVRVRLDHRKQHDRRGHSTGITYRLHAEQGAELGHARQGPAGQFNSRPEGGAWNLTCGGCGAVLTRRDDQLIRAALEAIASGGSVATLT